MKIWIVLLLVFIVFARSNDASAQVNSSGVEVSAKLLEVSWGKKKFSPKPFKSKRTKFNLIKQKSPNEILFYFMPTYIESSRTVQISVNRTEGIFTYFNFGANPNYEIMSSDCNPPFQNCNFVLKFKPTEEGVLNASVNIAYRMPLDTEDQHFTIDFQGEGKRFIPCPECSS